MKFSLSGLAYFKLTLHAAQHPHCGVNGVLIGKKKQEASEVVIEDTIPLFHQHLSLAPMLEFALLTIEQHCSKNNLSIVGFYHAAQSIEKEGSGAAAQLDPVAAQVATRINENFEGSACLLAIDNAIFLASHEPHIKVSLFFSFLLLLFFFFLFFSFSSLLITIKFF
jgi:hypothetical protein